MSKKELKTYLNGLSKQQLEDQVLDLYGRIKQVRTFYDFVFRPKEDALLEEARFKIAREYFPVNGRKPKTRRSVAQKHIRQFIQLGVQPAYIADIMLFNIEVAQEYTANKAINQQPFYTSMLKSFKEAVVFADEHQLTADLLPRMTKIVSNAKTYHWWNDWEFEEALNRR
jgi:hypothetical protein